MIIHGRKYIATAITANPELPAASPHSLTTGMDWLGLYHAVPD
jgi:hypothetical protein